MSNLNVVQECLTELANVTSLHKDDPLFGVLVRARCSLQWLADQYLAQQSINSQLRFESLSPGPKSKSR